MSAGDVEGSAGGGGGVRDGGVSPELYRWMESRGGSTERGLIIRAEGTAIACLPDMK